MDDCSARERSAVRELSCRLCLCNDIVKLKPLTTELKRKLRKLFDVKAHSMDDCSARERSAVRELSCRLCLCNDIVKLKPLTTELKRKLRKLFDVEVRLDDNLPKAICHDCLQQIGSIHRYAVKVEKTKNFLLFHQCKKNDNKDGTLLSQTYVGSNGSSAQIKTTSDLACRETPLINENKQITASSEGKISKRGSKLKPKCRHKPSVRETMTLEEFVRAEGVDHTLLVDGDKSADPLYWRNNQSSKDVQPAHQNLPKEALDPIVLVNGRPAKKGSALDLQITLFFNMECMICHQSGFNFKSLMHHYKEGHGVPGYVTCCEKKFHYFFPRKIVEHMAYHLQPEAFMCESCHENFQSSLELSEHRMNGGRRAGRLLCPRCGERYPTWRELGRHLVEHRVQTPPGLLGDEDEGKEQCDYCGKWLQHHHRKKTANGMKDLILCSPCSRALKKENGDASKHTFDQPMPKNSNRPAPNPPKISGSCSRTQT